MNQKKNKKGIVVKVGKTYNCFDKIEITVESLDWSQDQNVFTAVGHIKDNYQDSGR